MRELAWLEPLAHKARRSDLCVAIAKIYDDIGMHCRLSRQGEDKGPPRLAAIRWLELAAAVEPEDFVVRQLLGRTLLNYPQGRDVQRGLALLQSVPEDQQDEATRATLEIQVRKKAPRPAPDTAFDRRFDYKLATDLQGYGVAQAELRRAKAALEAGVRSSDKPLQKEAADHLYRLALVFEASSALGEWISKHDDEWFESNQELITHLNGRVRTLASTVHQFSYPSHGRIAGSTAKTSIGPATWKLIEKVLGPTPKVLDLASLIGLPSARS
jgi:hypothetical protein